MKTIFLALQSVKRLQKISIRLLNFTAPDSIVPLSDMIKTLAHICILSKDLNRSLDFYCGALGLKRHFDFFKDGDLFGFYLAGRPRSFHRNFQNRSGRRKSAASESTISAWKWTTLTRCATR